VPTHRFPFREYPRRRPDGVIENDLRPTVDFSVVNGNLDWSADALIDTGSPRTILTHEVGEAIGVPFGLAPTDDCYEHVEMLNSRVAVQRHSVELRLNRWPDLGWRADVWFTMSAWTWKLPVMGIFGVEGFLDRWAVTLLAGRQEFVVEDQAAYEARERPRPTVTGPVPDVEDWWRPTVH